MPINTVSNSAATASVQIANPSPATPVVRQESKAAPSERQDLPSSGQPLPSAESKPAAGARDLESAVTKLNDHIQLVQRDLHISVDDDTGKTIVKVMDSESGDVIRQIPSEEVIAISQALSENLDRVEGLILREEA